MTDDTTTYATVEVVARAFTLHGECPETGEDKAATQGDDVRIPTTKADTLKALGKVRDAHGSDALDALDTDDYQAMRRAASALDLDVGSSPDKATLREALEAHTA